MKQKICMLLVLLCTYGFSQEQEKGAITITINPIKSQGEGQIVFMLFDQEEGFPKEVTRAKFKGVVSDFEKVATYTFENIPLGHYAIAVFQDKNKNDAIDSNFMGMPKEPVAASNMNGMGRPSFKKSKIGFTKSKTTISLSFIND